MKDSESQGSQRDLEGSVFFFPFLVFLVFFDFSFLIFFVFVLNFFASVSFLFLKKNILFSIFKKKKYMLSTMTVNNE